MTNNLADDPAKLEAAMTFLRFMNDNNFEWARTGHISVRTSVLESEEYQSLPHRAEYVRTVGIARAVPHMLNYNSVEQILNAQLGAVVVTDKPVEDALADADARITEVLAVH